MPEIQPMNYSVLTCSAAHTLSDKNSCCFKSLLAVMFIPDNTQCLN